MANILVVDDYRDTADTAAMWLKQMGHNVQIARDGYQAIELARRQRPQFVLLDIGMPGLDGYAVAATLRQELAGPLIIIAITGYGQVDDRHKALAAGCDHYFLKPADPDALIMLFSASNIEQDFLVPDEPQPVGEGREKRSTPTAPGQLSSSMPSASISVPPANSSGSPRTSRRLCRSSTTAAKQTERASSTWLRLPLRAAPGSNWRPTVPMPMRLWMP